VRIELVSSIQYGLKVCIERMVVTTVEVFVILPMAIGDVIVNCISVRAKVE
jgi:glucose uptake protein GlcU